MMKEARSVLFSVTALLVVSGCGSSVDITEEPECPVPDRTMSSLEGESYARCFVPGNDSAEVIGYVKDREHDDLHVGRFEGWLFVFRQEGVYYSTGVGIGGASSKEVIAPTDCAAGSLPVLDSVELIPAATVALSGIDPVPENRDPYMIHSMPCLSWGWDPVADARAVVYFLPDWEGEPYRAVMFDDSGAVSRVCSENACDAGQTGYCCE